MTHRRRVPALVRWPKKIPAGKILNGIVSHQDWFGVTWLPLVVLGVAMESITHDAEAVVRHLSVHCCRGAEYVPTGVCVLADGPLKNRGLGNAMGYAIRVRDRLGRLCRGYVSATVADEYERTPR